MSDFSKNLLLFFDRPMEPIYMPKGKEKTMFKMPNNYYIEEYKELTVESEHHGYEVGAARYAKTLEIAKVNLPDLTIPMKLSRFDRFCFFVPAHAKMAKELIDIFMSRPHLEDLMSVLVYCQPRINPYLFNYCLSVAILHRPDTKGITLPTFAETFPDKFVDCKTLRIAREYCAVCPEHQKPPMIKVVFPVNPDVPEQRVTYFREDVGVNSHHWHWHLIYPSRAGQKALVAKDRRGELFYYMHHQIIARYNVERMCNGLERTKAYYDFSKPILEGYFPILDAGNASRAWAPRLDYYSPSNTSRPKDGIKISIIEMEVYRQRILDAIEDMAIKKTDGTMLPLDEDTGIDKLGNLIEATLISENPMYYGDYHNQGHNIIGCIHDPHAKHSQPVSVMCATETAMRDPVFYRWHASLDDIFVMFKDKLPHYPDDKLEFDDVSVTSVNIEGVAGENNIHTFWENSIIKLTNGLDFAKHRPIFGQVTHLQQENFNYLIKVNNKSSQRQMGTIRIFMAPTTDQVGKPLTFDEQRILMIEMDKFSQPLCPGQNTIHRRSLDSSVTIPYERIFRDYSGNLEDIKTDNANYCDCGWPQHLLMPKGNKYGYEMVLFVMVSNWNEDKVQRSEIGVHCDNASYCGLRDQKYPDKQAMGFPFNRKAKPGVDCLEEFLRDNMACKKFTIKFTGQTRDRWRDGDEAKEKTAQHQCEEAGEGKCH